MASTPRSSSARAAATTPHRRSQAELLEQISDLFDLVSTSRPTSPLLSLPHGAASPGAARTAPLRLLPELLLAFERKRSIQLITVEERQQLQGMVDALPEGMEDQPVGVEQVLELLVNLGVTSHGSSTTPVGTPQAVRTQQETQMLRADAPIYPSADGSPVPRHRRTTSSSSSLSAISTAPSLIPAPVSALQGSPAARRRSLMSTLSRSSPSSSPSQSAAHKSLRKRKTFEDLSALVVQQGGTYLGVGLDGPTGEGWIAEELARKVRAVMATKNPNRERELVALLTPLTYPQAKALDHAYASGSAQGLGQGRTLLDIVTAEKAFKGTVDFALRGLLMGPLAWDVWLLQKALEGTTINHTLLIDLLIARPPSALALLRAAYSHRSSSRALSSATGTTATRSLDVAVLSAYSSNLRLRKAWEVALQARWDDCDGDEEEDVPRDEDTAGASMTQRREKLLKEDLDQLKVALRRGGNTEIAAKILLARSPAHLHALVVEYRKSTGGHSSLTKAIKQCIPAGTLQRLFLHAVENAKNVAEGQPTGVWRDAKALEKAVGPEKGGKREELLWRLIRLHWDRPRFLAVQQAFRQKYRKSLVDRVRFAAPAGVIVDIVDGLVTSATLPEPQPSQQDEQRLEALTSPLRSRTSSSSSLASLPGENAAPLAPPSEVGSEAGSSTSSKSGSRHEAAELEAEGELSDPPSPRSPPVLSHEGAHAELDFEMDDAGEGSYDMATPLNRSLAGPEPATPTLPQDGGPMQRSTSSMSLRSIDGPGSRPSSSLSRKRPSDHRPPSSQGGSADSTKLNSSLRHSRPVAPGRAKRRQSEEAARRAGSEEPMSPTSPGMRSPTPSGDSRCASLSRSTSSNTDISLASSTDSGRSLSRSLSTPGELTFGSPPTSIDTTSFFSTPLSPIRDESRPSSSFFPNASSTPPPASPDRPAGTVLFGTAGATPDSPERFFTSTAMRRDPSSQSSGRSSRPSSLFGEGGLDAIIATGSPASHSRDLSGNAEQFQQLLRHAQDLSRKLKETEARFQATASTYEEEVSDLESRLEEARSELQVKRREEKELRNVEKEHLQQISSLEGDIAKLTKSLERSREAYDNMKRSYTSTCDEAERLRALVAETRREHRAAEEAIQTHSLQVQQFERDRDLLQQAISKLEQDLSEARRAQDSLDDQKQENLLLKETIDKLRFEIEEMRAVGRKSGFVDAGPAAGVASPAKSLADSLSRSLGREIASQVAAEQNDSSEGEETEGEDGVDDIIVTTHRRIKKRGKKSSASTPIITHVETSVSVSDADIQTEPVPVREVDVQTDISALTDDLVKAADVKPQVIEVKPPIRTERQMQEDLAKGLGVSLDVVKQAVESQKTGGKAAMARILGEFGKPAVNASSRRTGRWRTRLMPGAVAQAPSYFVNAFPEPARPYVALFVNPGFSLFCFTAAVYLVGVVSGSRFLPVTHHHTVIGLDGGLFPSDLSWEGLAVGTGHDGGFAPEGLASYLYEMIYSGMRSARRIPV